MKRYKIVFICHFSNSIVREVLNLKTHKVQNAIRKKVGTHLFRYDDFAIWVSDYIQEFEKHPEYDFHIVAPHLGMKDEIQEFVVNSINYHFFKCDSNYLSNVLKEFLKLDEKQNYRNQRRVVKSFISTINPDIVLLCGAENPNYSTSVLDIHDKPIYVIPQTFLNDPKRIEMGVGSSYKREIEKEIMKHAKYFCVAGDNIINYIRTVNNEAVILPVAFPTHRPIINIPDKKEFDYVFFARIVTKNKGIEDLLRAFAIVKSSYANIRLNVIGRIDDEYKSHIEKMIQQLGIRNNIILSGYYDNIDDTFANVVKAKVVVVPGITAGLNSTVREAMYMGLPTICYSTTATDMINKEKTCLMTAPVGDIEALARLMSGSLERAGYTKEVANNGKDYAEREFGNEAIVNKLLDNCLQIIEKKI